MSFLWEYISTAVSLMEERNALSEEAFQSAVVISKIVYPSTYFIIVPIV